MTREPDQPDPPAPDRVTFELSALVTVDVAAWARSFGSRDVAVKTILSDIAEYVREALADLPDSGALTDDTLAVSAPTACRWFARCDRDAVSLIRHPTLGAVPACADCARQAQRGLVR